MYQQELFARVIKTQGKLGDGLYANVHAIDDEWVVKYSRTKDETLNYLEWCKAMQDAGKRMKGMPTIDRIVHCDLGYMVTMRRYTTTLAKRAEESDQPAYHDLLDKVRAAAWFLELKEAYAEHMEVTFGQKGGVFGDCHGGNIMWDGPNESWVVTDPDSGYYRSSYSFPMLMYVEQQEKQQVAYARSARLESVPVLPVEPSPAIATRNRIFRCREAHCIYCQEDGRVWHDDGWYWQHELPERKAFDKAEVKPLKITALKQREKYQPALPFYYGARRW